MEYASIKNLYASNGVNGAEHKRGPEFGFSNPAFGSVTNWLVTEKVDGMNMRVVLNPYGFNDSPDAPELRICGRTDKAQIPGDLLAHMQETFPVEKVMAALGFEPAVEGEDGYPYAEQCTEYAYQYQAVLYGEGYGPGIQKAGTAYGGEKRFILFDVLVTNDGAPLWLDWDDVVDVASKLGIPHVPVLARGVGIDEAVEFVHSSRLLEDPTHVEGFVARAEPQLFDKLGNRMMFKYKVRDL